MIDFSLDTEHPIQIECDHAEIEGLLHIPKHAKGIVIFAHGSGSSRFSSRNQSVARVLQMHGFATLLFDLLTTDEDMIDSITAQFRFDISFLANRLVSVTQWVLNNPVLNSSPIGYFGASTGAAAALVAAAQLMNNVKAVVSRGGRPDLAGESLAYVEAPTLLIVGGADDAVIPLNQTAQQALHCPNELVIVDGATHLFEEPGKLDEVAKLAADWFDRHLIK